MANGARKRFYYFKFFAAEFLSDDKVDDSTAVERGILVTLWAMYFRTEKPLRDDAKYYARKIGCDEGDVQAVLERFFRKVRGGWRSQRMDDELEASAKRRSKARKGAASRWPEEDADPEDFDSGDAGGCSKHSSKHRSEECSKHSPKECHVEQEQEQEQDSVPATAHADHQQSGAIHSESGGVAEDRSLLGPERQTRSYASTSEPVRAGELLHGTFRGRAV